jgi:TRAP-type C4-dicarboxylate transport system substrate-binding protein
MNSFKQNILRVFIFSYFMIYSIFTQAAPTPIVWDIQSNKLAGSIQFQLEQQTMSRIEELSRGELKFNVVSIDSIFLAKSTFSAVRFGKLQGMFMTPQYWGGADVVFSIYGDLVAAWESPEQYRQWLEQEQGLQYLQSTYHRFGLHQVGYMVSPAESLVSTVPIANLNDFRGKSIRTPPGMVADFFTLLGAKPKEMSMSQVIGSLANHRIQMTDYSNIVVNDKVGLYGVAKHTNYPGFHSMALLDFVVNKKAWDALEPKHQAIVKLVISDWEKSLDQEMELKLDQVIERLKSQGVILYQWDAQELKKARNIAKKIWQEYALKSPEAHQVISQLMAWLESNGNI